MKNGYPTNQMFSNQRIQQNQHYGQNKQSPHMLYHPTLNNNNQNNQLQSTNSLLAQSLGPHYAKQLETAHRARLATAPHHHARVAASHSRLTNLGNHQPLQPLNQANIGSPDNLLPKSPIIVEKSSWTTLDMGGMMINHLNSALFQYDFLTCLYLNHNNLVSLPQQISKLTHLTTLNLTGNKLSSLPAELGLLVSLKELLLFDNQLTYIPQEFGQLYQLEFLGIDGNPMSEPISSMITEKGTSAVVKYLRDSYTWPIEPGLREWIEIEDANSNTSGNNY